MPEHGSPSSRRRETTGEAHQKISSDTKGCISAEEVTAGYAVSFIACRINKLYYRVQSHNECRRVLDISL